MQYRIINEESIASPALLYYKEALTQNLKATIQIAGSPERLWPHVKTHKISEMIRMQMDMGISRFKCATAAEVRMVAECGAKEILWVYPLIGPSIRQYFTFCENFSAICIDCIVDSKEGLLALSQEAQSRNTTARVFIDVDGGMHRTGVSLDALRDFIRECKNTPGIRLIGLHCYDGHIHDPDLQMRKEKAEVFLSSVREICKDFPCLQYIFGGSPTFPVYAQHGDLFLSPGTVFVWDHGYAANYPEMPFVPAAAILCRVVSHPGERLFTIDVGYKAISADPAGQRGFIVGMEDFAFPVSQSEEHWVWQVKDSFPVPAIGTVLYIIPTHICPTTALYDSAFAVHENKAQDKWCIAARDRISEP